MSDEQPGELSEEQSEEDWVGRLLAGRYQIVSRLGAGGMASVYLARDANVMDRTVVVKIPLAALMKNPTNRRRFLEEVRSLARQTHPNVVRIQDFGEHAGRPFLVVEYLKGGDLAQRVAAHGGRLSPDEVLQWLPTVAETLDFVHVQHLVHRDVKPGNILFGAEGHVYLSDFGIAAQMELLDDDATKDDQGQLTAVGGFVGSPAYAPPEAVSRTLTPAYDQYSLGVVAYAVLAGRLPFDAPTAEAYLIAKAKDDPVPLEDLAPDLPRGCTRAVMKALSRDPSDRFESCRDFAQAFADGRQAGANALPLRGLLRAAVVAGLLVATGIGLRAWLSETDAQPAPPSPATTSPTFRAGSTAAEIQAALELCRSHQDECLPEWYASEAPRVVAIPTASLEPGEVTNAAFAAFVSATGHRTTAEIQGFSWIGPLRRSGLSWRTALASEDAATSHPDHPVVHVSQADAAAYCAWAGGRLPTDDEWEYTARSVDRRLFPWGDDWDPSRAAWRGRGEGGLLPVGSVPEGDTPEGHHDLAGNVWEWTASDLGEGVALKGGSHLERNPANLRAAAQLEAPATDTASDWGIRCARDPD